MKMYKFSVEYYSESGMRKWVVVESKYFNKLYALSLAEKKYNISPENFISVGALIERKRTNG